jgi:hypothetical protein
MQLENTYLGKDFVVVDVSARDGTVFSTISTALGLPPQDKVADLGALKEIQIARWKKLKLSELQKDRIEPQPHRRSCRRKGGWN